MKYFAALLLTFMLFSCGEEDVVEEREEIVIETRDDLIELVDGIFTEYHPGTDKKRVKFQGPQDENKQRHGIWYFYNLNNIQVSMTEYKHGLKNGVSLVKYDNGIIRYSGQYKDNEQIGIWKTYDSTGVMLHEKDFGDLQ